MTIVLCTGPTVQKWEAVTYQVPEAVHGHVNTDNMKMPLLGDWGADQSSQGLGPRSHSQRARWTSANEWNVSMKGPPVLPTQGVGS